jgi:hypothetical protein
MENVRETLSVQIPYDIDFVLGNGGCNGTDVRPCMNRSPFSRICFEDGPGDAVTLTFAEDKDFYYVDTDPQNNGYEYSINRQTHALWAYTEKGWEKATDLNAQSQLPHGQSREGSIDLNDRDFRDCLFSSAGWVYRYEEAALFLELIDSAYTYLEDKADADRPSASAIVNEVGYFD